MSTDTHTHTHTHAHTHTHTPHHHHLHPPLNLRRYLNAASVAILAQAILAQVAIVAQICPSGLFWPADGPSAFLVTPPGCWGLPSIFRYLPLVVACQHEAHTLHFLLYILYIHSPS